MPVTRCESSSRLPSRPTDAQDRTILRAAFACLPYMLVMGDAVFEAAVPTQAPAAPSSKASRHHLLRFRLKRDAYRMFRLAEMSSVTQL